VPHSLLSPLKVIERKWQMSASGTKRNLSPLPKPRLHCAHLVLLKGRCREALRRRDGVRRPRVLRNKALGRHFGAPPGTIRSPCQELADRPAIAGNGKRGPVLAKRRNGAPEGARAVPPEPRDHRFASFGAPPPRRVGNGSPVAHAVGTLRFAHPTEESISRTLKCAAARVALRPEEAWSSR
jgi:hypothetical protein